MEKDELVSEQIIWREKQWLHTRRSRSCPNPALDQSSDRYSWRKSGETVSPMNIYGPVCVTWIIIAILVTHARHKILSRRLKVGSRSKSSTNWKVSSSTPEFFSKKSNRPWERRRSLPKSPVLAWISHRLSRNICSDSPGTAVFWFGRFSAKVSNRRQTQSWRFYFTSKHFYVFSVGCERT